MSGANLIDLRLKAEVFDYDFYNSVLSAGPELRYIHAVRPYFHLISAANLDRRSYNKSTKRNGLYGSVGEYARFFFGDAGHQFMFGAATWALRLIKTITVMTAGKAWPVSISTCLTLLRSRPMPALGRNITKARARFWKPATAATTAGARAWT